MNILTSAPTTPGWYAIGFHRMDAFGGVDAKLEADLGPDWGPIWQFDGQDWYNEDGDLKDSLFDPTLQAEISPSGADFYVAS